VNPQLVTSTTKASFLFSAGAKSALLSPTVTEVTRGVLHIMFLEKLKAAAVYAALILGLAAIAPVVRQAKSADWFHDFDGVADDPVTDWKWPWPPSPTFQSDYAYTVDGTNRMFRAWESRTPSEGGTQWTGLGSSAADASIIDVRVGATINPAGGTDDRLGVLARGVEWGKFYFTSVNFTTGDFIIFTATGVGTAEFLTMADPIEDLSRSYYIEMDVLGQEEPQITVRLFDELGGSLLRTITAVDTAVGGPAYGFGPAGTYGEAAADSVLDVSFDDISAITVPEPSSFALTLMAFCGVLVVARKRE
jgi:hypothetical protein